MDGHSDEHAARAASAAPIALVRCSSDGGVAWVNGAANALLGITAGAQLLELVEGHQREQVSAYLHGLSTPGRRARLETETTAGTPVELLGTADADGVVTLSAYDLSEFRAELDQVRSSARTDHLTGLGNRLAFFEAAQQARMAAGLHGTSAAVVTVDLDRFKQTNDTFGHAVGDEALRHVADVLRRCSDENETVARFGGDEFVVCVPDGGIDRASAYTEQVAAGLAAGASIAGHEITVSAAFGIAGIDVSLDIGIALQEADVALYQAKVRGGARTVVYSVDGQDDDEDLGQIGRTVAHLRQRADVDTRTGLARDHVFDADLPIAIDHARRNGAPLSLLLVDLDRFHSFNELYLYEAGHRALRAVAGALTGAVRAGDRCYRYGGEELSVLLANTDTDDAMATAERIRRAVESLAIHHEGTPTSTLTVSVGVSTVASGDQVEPAWLVNGANLALDRAKRSGRNRCAAAAPSTTAPPVHARS